MIYKLLLILGVGCNIVAQLLLKHGMKGLDIVFSGYTLLEKFKTMVLNFYFWAALLSYGAGFLLYAVVLSKINLNVAYPVASVLAIVVIYLISLVYFREPSSVTSITGVVLCIAGIILLLK